jgi:hypothetical protein
MFTGATWIITDSNQPSSLDTTIIAQMYDTTLGSNQSQPDFSLI